MKKKDKKKLLIALAVLTAVILMSLGTWNYAASNGNFLKFNQKVNIPVEKFTDTDMNFTNTDMNYSYKNMKFSDTDMN